jgi:hypothetical protein
VPTPREESNVINGLVPSAAIPSAAIQAQADKIAALAKMTARFVKLGLRRQDRGTCRDLAGMVNTGARGACRSRQDRQSTEGRIASARRKARIGFPGGKVAIERPWLRWLRRQDAGSSLLGEGGARLVRQRGHPPDAGQRLAAQALPLAFALVAECYSVQIRRDGGADYRAISDIGPAELAKFRWLFDASDKPGPNKRG